MLKVEALAKSDVKAVPPLPPKPDVSAKSNAAPLPPPAPKKRGFFRRLYRLVTRLILLGAISFVGGVWYSRVNDNFHDFFTEYVPFGEQAVLYVEEWDFRKKYSGPALGGTDRKDTAERVKIPPSSGASWRVADGPEPGGRQSSAVRKVNASKKAAKEEKKEPAPESKPEPEAPKPSKSTAPEKTTVTVSAKIAFCLTWTPNTNRPQGRFQSPRSGRALPFPAGFPY